MKRNSTIASIAAATGIVGATVIAAISLMQATVTSSSENDTVTLAAPSATMPMSSDLVFVPEQLPEIPVISDSATPQSKGQEASTQKAGQISRNFATKAVVNATNGTVTQVDSINHNGVDAFAVTVKRTDGSVITGYVDRSSGDVYEWAVVKAAPVQQYEDDEYEGDKYKGDEEHEDEDHEDERDHDDD